MTRLPWIAALAAAAVACQPTTAEINCGKSACGANQRCEPTQLVCVLDEPPELTITEPRVGTLVAGETLVVGGTVRDDNGAATLELSLDDGATWFKVPVASAKFSAKVGLPVLDYQPLRLSLRAHDSHQQATKAQVGVMVDNVAPQLTVASPADGAVLNVAWFGGDAKVSGLASDGSGLASLSVDVGDGPRPEAAGGPAFEQPWAAPQGEDGVPHTVVVTAIDLAGNRTTVERTVTVDVVAPQVSFTVPAIGAVLGASFFEGGGRLRGPVSKGARVVAQLGLGPQQALIRDGEWSVAYALPRGLDFVPQTLEVTATDDAGNSTRAAVIAVVDVVAPRLSFANGLQGAKLNASNFSAGDDVLVGWTVADGDPQVDVRSGNAIAPSPLKVTTSPTDNPKAYSVALTAQDRAGNSSQAQVSFAVDRVRPTVTSQTPAANDRNTTTTAVVEFSEAVAGVRGLALTPPATSGTWVTSKRFEAAGLPNDTVVIAAVDAVVDAFGNPVVVPPAIKFHTSPALPASGATLMNDVWKFKVSADADGVLTLFTTSPTTPATYRWARVNPKTGLVEDNRPAWAPTLGAGFSEVGVYSAASANPDLSAHRVSAATTYVASVIDERRAWVRTDDDAATSAIGMVGVVPARPLPNEGAGLGEVGYLKFTSGTVSYARTGKADLGLGMGVPTAMGFAAGRWEAIEARNSTLKRTSFVCSEPLANGPASCTFTPVAQWTDVAATDTVSFAMTEACSFYAYDNTAGQRVVRVEPFASACSGKACPAVVPSMWTLPLSVELRVAANGTQGLVGAQRILGGGVQLVHMTLNANCIGFWVNDGIFPVPTGAAFEPVSLQGMPALLYVDSNHDLKLERL